LLQTPLRLRAGHFLDRHFSGEVIDWQRVLAIFLPVLVDQAFVTCMNFINVAMISSSGEAAIAAVNMVDSLNIFLVSVFIAVSTGGTVVVAQFKGHGDDNQLSKAAAGSISSCFLLSAGISVAFIALHNPVLKLLFNQAEPAVFANAKIYLIGSCASYAGIAVEEGVCGALRGVGRTRSTLALSFIMNITYVLLNVLFITVLHMGVLGLVISINISRYFAAGCALFYLARWDNPVRFRFADALHFNPAMLKKIFFIGIPFAAEQMFFNGGKILTQTFIVRLGTLALATNAICGSITGLLQVPSNALVITAITVVGQCIGGGNIPDARKFIRSFLLLASAFSIATSALFLPILRPMISLFDPSDSIVSSIVLIIWITAAAQILLWPISFLTPSALRAAGDAKFTSVVALLSMWLIRVVLGYILAVVLPFGVIGVWVAMDFEWGIRGTIFLIRSRGDKWYQHKLIE
jgi:putative MATE family efflux protein